MNYFSNWRFHIVGILMIVCLLLCSLGANAQGNQKKSIQNVAIDNEEETDATDSTQKFHKPHKVVAFIFGDFGRANIKSISNGISQSANGLTWAVSGQLGFRLNKNKNTRVLLSIGLEVRNFNGTYSSLDGEGVTAYDNLHFYYAGVPIIFQLVNTKHRIGHKHDLNYYLQAGLSTGIKLQMTDFYSDNGTNTKKDLSKDYNLLLLQPMVSAGVSYTTKHKVYLLGPYCAYSVNNISNQSGVTENILSYGVRLTACLFR